MHLAHTAAFEHPPPPHPLSTPEKLPREYNVLCKVTSNSWQAFCRVNVEDAPGQSASTEARWEPPPPPSTLCQSPDTSFCHLCRPAPSCQQFKSAWWRLPPVAADNTAVQMLPAPKRWRRQRGLTSVLPVGTTEQHFAAIPCQWADGRVSKRPAWSHRLVKPCSAAQ